MDRSPWWIVMIDLLGSKIKPSLGYLQVGMFSADWMYMLVECRVKVTTVKESNRSKTVLKIK